jgi:PAS domain S-box-containing protein
MSRSFGPDDLAAIFGDLERVVKMGCYVWDVTHKDAVWSDGMYRLLGLPHRANEEPASGDAFYELVHPDDRADVRLAHMRIFTGGEAPDVTYRIIRPDGEVRVIRGYGAVARDASGKIVRVVGALTDITAVAAASDRLQETDARLAEVEEAAGVGSHVYELKTKRVEWSRALFDIFGVDRGMQPTAELAASLIHPDDRVRQTEWAARVAQGDVVTPLVTRIVRPDGVLRWIETRCRRVEAPTGPRVIGLTLDVTMRVELEERLRQAAKLEAVGTLAAGVAHDFNNYLAVMMLESGNVSEALRTAIQQCAALTAQLIAFARKHANVGTVVDVRDSIASTVDLFKRLADPNTTIEVDVPSAPSCVVADAGQLDGILMNLLINARDAMPAGGTIVVRLEEVQVEPSVAALQPGCAPGPHVKLTVRDTGTGIAPEHLPRIFEPYFSTKALSRGTGLGLASVYASVKQHRGFIRVESVVDRGSAFEVFLPMTKSTPEIERPPPAADESGLSGTVLVVEDMPSLLEVAARILRASGLTVHTATSGEGALDVLKGNAVDVVLTDVVMPGMGGFELAKALPSIAPGARLVFMSGYLDGALLERIERDVPGRLMIRKPFDKAELVRVIAQALAS